MVRGSREPKRGLEGNVNTAGRLFLLSVVPLALACIGLFWFFIARLELAAERAMEHRAVSNAEIVASTLGPVLDVDVPEVAQERLDTLRGSPDLISAALVKRDGAILAAWGRPVDAPDSEPTAGHPVLRWSADVLQVTTHVPARRVGAGRLALAFSLTDFHRERQTTLAIAGAGVGLVLLGGGILSLLLAYYLVRRRAAEAAQRRSEASFRALIEALPDALVIERGGRVVYVNGAAVRLLGAATQDDLIGLAPSAVFGGDHGTSAALSWDTLHLATHAVHVPEIGLRRRHGGTFPAEVLALPVAFDGAPAGVVVARDLTERKRIQAQLLHADRMASMGTLAAGVAHEINNPMAYVTTNLNFALDALERPVEVGAAAREDLRQALIEAQEGAERVRHIVLSLKAYSRSDDEVLVPVDVERALDAAINISRAEIKARAELVRKRGGVPPVVGQESRLVQVFVNLLTNAAQAIPSGDVAAHRIEVATSVGPDGRVCVAVIDTGSGIAADNLPRLFDPFFTTKPVGEGTGLGLSICQGIVRTLGGEIRVSSTVGEGSRFEVWLRTAQPAVAAADAAAPPSPDPLPTPRTPAPPAPPRMLVVDDEARIAQSIARLFNREYRVVAETDAREALVRLRDDPDFDVIVCDLMMPQMGGVEFFEAVRAMSPRLARRVVFLTGGAFTPETTAFLDQVRNPVVEKPFEAERLRVVLDEIRRRTGEPPALT